MKAIFLVLGLLITMHSHAQSVPARINYLVCRNLNTSVIFTGNWGPDAYFNVTNVNAFGLPFTQQARVVEVNARPNQQLQFRLQTMLTNAEIYLTIVNGTSKGYLQSKDGSEPILTLECTSQIVR